MELDAVLDLLRALDREQVAYKLVGAVAMGVHGLARATEDIDLFVDPSDDNVERLRRALRAVFDDPSIEEITGADLRGDYPAIQYVPPGAPFHVDLLARLGEAFDYQAIEAERRELGGVPVRVATPGMLHRMKRDTVRPQDRADAARLAERFGLEG